MAGEKTFNVSIVGYGLSAKVFHIPFIAATKGLKLHSIVQRSPSAGNSVLDDHPSTKHFTSFEQVLQDPEVDVVVVGTPPNTHFDFVRRALESGKHVLVEKPFVPTSAQAEELATVARTSKRVLCVYQNRRWDADFLTVQKLLRDNTLGRVLEFETHFDRWKPEKPSTWKGSLGMAEGGGVLFDLGTHVLDQVYMLFGKPTTVSARFVNQREGRLVNGDGPDQEPDSLTAVLSYAETGTLVFARMAVMSTETQQMRFWIRGTKGSYRKSGMDPQEPQLVKEGMKVTDAGFGQEPSTQDGKLSLVTDGGQMKDEVCPSLKPPETYLKFYELFAKSLQSGREEDVPVTAAQAADVLLILEAIKASAKADGAPR